MSLSSGIAKVARAVLLYEMAKKSPGQETGLGNRGRMKVLNDTKLVSMSMNDLLII